MTDLDAIHKINQSNASDKIKEALCLVASEFDYFLQLKAKHPNDGLMTACYKGFGVKFLGMYSVESLNDLVRKAEMNSLLA